MTTELSSTGSGSISSFRDPEEDGRGINKGKGLEGGSPKDSRLCRKTSDVRNRVKIRVTAQRATWESEVSAVGKFQVPDSHL